MACTAPAMYVLFEILKFYVHSTRQEQCGLSVASCKTQRMITYVQAERIITTSSTSSTSKSKRGALSTDNTQHGMHAIVGLHSSKLAIGKYVNGRLLYFHRHSFRTLVFRRWTHGIEHVVEEVQGEPLVCTRSISESHIRANSLHHLHP